MGIPVLPLSSSATLRATRGPHTFFTEAAPQIDWVRWQDDNRHLEVSSGLIPTWSSGSPGASATGPAPSGAGPLSGRSQSTPHRDAGPAGLSVLAFPTRDRQRSDTGDGPVGAEGAGESRGQMDTGGGHGRCYPIQHSAALHLLPADGRPIPYSTQARPWSKIPENLQ